jgi:hypothetical protein
MVVSKLTIYNWKRFWIPRDGRLNLGDSGFLVDPDGDYGASSNPDVLSFDKIQDTPCLILLGEPGTGKSTALVTHKKSTDQALQNVDASLMVDLRSFQSDIRLIQGVFEHPAFVAWRSGTHRLHLFLDSFDEGLLRVSAISSILGDEFQKYPIERLLLRIACRTADWPLSLERRLLDIWRQDQVRVFEIAPLRRSDVTAAAVVEGLNADKFLEEIRSTQSTSLAIKPVTLRFLIALFKKNGEFPLNQADLYQQGCRLLCDETNEERREAKLTGAFSADQRLAVASRIAAATVFGNRNAIWTNADFGESTPEDVTVEELIGETETFKGNTFSVTESSIRETLATGLFSSRGPYRTGWAHQTYAEFLAAKYVLDQQFSEEQIMSLLVHPGDQDGKTVPQLQEVAGWISASSPPIYRRLTATDPRVILRGDAGRADDEDTAHLVEAILIGVENDQLFLEIEERPDLYKLAHSGIEDQLRPYIVDRSKKDNIREFAIDVARACKLQGLQNDVAKIGLDTSEAYQLRKHATFFVSQVADSTTRAMLKPLTEGSAEDVDDDLKGWALRAIWPDDLTPEELFKRLSPPKRQNYIGGYNGFLHQLEESITPDLLPVGLNWAESYTGSQSELGGLVDKLILLGFEYIQKPEVLDSYVRVLLKRIRERYAVLSDRSDKEFSSRIAEDSTKRRLLLTNLVKAAKDPADRSLALFRLLRFVPGDDFPWLLDQCIRAESPKLASAFAQLITFAFDVRNPAHVDAVIIASKESPELKAEFAWLTTPVELNSSEAAAMKQLYEMQQRISQPEKEEQIGPSPAERVLTLLQDSESGRPGAFTEMARQLSVKAGSNYYGDEIAVDITKFPGWQTAEGGMRGRIVEAARRFLAECDPTWDWLGGNSLPYAAVAGFRALRLLRKEDKKSFISLNATTWKRWVPAIIGHPFPTMDDEENAYQEFIELVQKHAPAEMVRAVRLVLEAEDKKQNDVFVLRHFETHWTDGLATMLMEKVKSGTLSPRGTAAVLSKLLQHEVGEAQVIVESWLPIPVPTEATERERAETAARLLIEYAKDAGWTVVWPAFQSDAEFGMAVVESTFTGFGYGKIPQLTEDQIADLYIWLVQRYPYSEDPKIEGFHAVSARETIARFRDALINHLSQRGTYAAAAGIEKIMAVFPDMNWLKRSLQDAREAARRKTWIPPTIQDLIVLAQKHERRFVQNGDQLLDVVVESLQRLAAKLQGETPAAALLWNELPGGKLRPKDENVLSDFVTIHLRDDLKDRGIIVNREVEIRRGYKPGKGERTDLHIDALAKDSRGRVLDTVTVIIETKGCWNRELDSAMETQLRDRYMKDNKCDHGLYLVGWFTCSQWDPSDSRKPPAETLEQVRKRFDQQAKDLSTGGTTIRAFVLNTCLRS